MKPFGGIEACATCDGDGIVPDLTGETGTADCPECHPASDTRRFFVLGDLRDDTPPMLLTCTNCGWSEQVGEPPSLASLNEAARRHASSCPGATWLRER